MPRFHEAKSFLKYIPMFKKTYKGYIFFFQKQLDDAPSIPPPTIPCEINPQPQEADAALDRTPDPFDPKPGPSHAWSCSCKLLC